ncbi:glycerophosphodiester phosphodiesterase family protein [Intrasporangium calvum]|uniref:Glycerophosphoryl diester phosphodiesterase n=1 Tax=Intrasporangium calvum (strain ATCC 23552 / DSM 43043 / JCM 3097 / NBRC 12989 / NCIMB 10167 / NRRL B-3866 / 7 KIP) TaxID=710696 RepID=E6S9I5_INTC7|nr:glycerophosphodiester phosphodiesterase family protein [Intrasporangium calvum]ADU48181.1 glycerophosphoryl diester phosphodiesterase [Intrasporangium calvum DSM 43043]
MQQLLASPDPALRAATPGMPPPLPADRGTTGPDRPRRWPGRQLDIQGHRGARALVVENTIPSFLAAFDAGATGVELDVRLTADGQVVVWHDPRIEAEKCRPTAEDLIGARVDELTLEQLRTIDVGSRRLSAFPRQRDVPDARIATLPEVLEVGRDRAPEVWWTIELKVDPTEPGVRETRGRLLDGVLEAVAAAGTARRSLIHSFDWAVLELARDQAPELQRSALVVTGVTYTDGSPWLGSLDWREHGDDLAGAVAAVGAHVVSPHHGSVDADLVSRAHDLGLGVLPWTVNEPDDLRRVVAAGVDGLITDDPELALSVVG